MSLLKYAAFAIVTLYASPALAGDPYAAGADVSAAYMKYSEALNSGNAGAAAAAFAEKGPRQEQCHSVRYFGRAENVWSGPITPPNQMMRRIREAAVVRRAWATRRSTSRCRSD